MFLKYKIKLLRLSWFVHIYNWSNWRIIQCQWKQFITNKMYFKIKRESMEKKKIVLLRWKMILHDCNIAQNPESFPCIFYVLSPLFTLPIKLSRFPISLAIWQTFVCTKTRLWFCSFPNIISADVFMPSSHDNLEIFVSIIRRPHK